MQQRKLCVSSPVIKMSGPNLFLSRAIALIPIFTIPFSHLKTETLHFLVTLLRPYFSILNPNSPFFSSTIFKLQPLPPFLDHLPPSHSPVSKPQPQPSPNFFLSPFSISLSDLKTQTFHLFATFLQPISPPQNQPLFFRFFIFNSIKIMS